ncbi:hypothetical protein ACQ4LE_011068 [Meloidogyne hapla]|uniref:Uncharacterized protein n=1 Tax=Meloidogyne hapla TaxID=6305 RepID=A0A1I8B0W4_MELHA
MWPILFFILFVPFTTTISETNFEAESNSTSLEIDDILKNSFLNETNDGINGTLNETANGTINGTTTTPIMTTQSIEIKQNSPSLRCLVGTQPLDKSKRYPPIEPLWCNDTVEYEKRKCLNIVCHTDHYGSFVWKSCGTCTGIRDVWGMSQSFYKHSCKCYECDNEDLCNSSFWNFGEITLIYFGKVILPLLVAIMFSNI